MGGVVGDADRVEGSDIDGAPAAKKARTDASASTPNASSTTLLQQELQKN